MPPVGLLALVALGLVFAYALPQRIREAGQYAVVRTETRYRPDMRVIRASAARASTPPPVAPRSTAARRAMVPKTARASIKALGGSTMARPAAPLDRAAIVTQRQMVAMRRDRGRVLQRRSAQARRRSVIGVLSVFAASTAWGMVAASALPLWSAVVATTAVGGVVIAGRSAVQAQKAADTRLVPVAREVATAAAAVSALQRVATERVAGRPVVPSIHETQAIAVITAETPPAGFASGARALYLPDADSDLASALAPASRPAALPSPELPGREEDPGWLPGMLPIPSYTLKPAAKVRVTRPISTEDLAAGVRAAEDVADRKAAAELARAAATPEAEASTSTLDDILARRRRHTA